MNEENPRFIKVEITNESTKERRESLLKIILLFSLAICLLVSVIFNILAHSQIEEKLKNLEQNKADRICHYKINETKILINITREEHYAGIELNNKNVFCRIENIVTEKADNPDIILKSFLNNTEWKYVKKITYFCIINTKEKICEIK